MCDGARRTGKSVGVGSHSLPSHLEALQEMVQMLE